MAIGFFDGVHIGHQAILRGATAAMTFSVHPLAVLAPERAPRLIMSEPERVAAIRACGIDRVVVLDFTPELAALSPDEFTNRYLLRDADATGGLCAQRMRCGENWRFGKGGAGDAAFLRRRGLAVDVVPYALYEGDRVSSSRIRASLERGEVEAANAMLGRPFVVRGEVRVGKGVGERIGYPTENLLPIGLNLRLPLGVYEVAAGTTRGIANYGCAPTMGASAWREPMLEVHWLSGETDCNRLQPTAIELVRFLRPERRFESVDALRRQIADDCRRVMI